MDILGTDANVRWGEKSKNAFQTRNNAPRPLVKMAEHAWSCSMDTRLRVNAATVTKARIATRPRGLVSFSSSLI